MGRSTTGKRALILGAAGALALAAGNLASPATARAAADEKGVAFFEAKIRPILANHCVSCHGEEKQKGDLRLDTREHLLAGAKHEDKAEKVVELGSPEKSKVIEAVEYKNEDIQMPPPKRNKATGKTDNLKLPDAQIADLKEWIKMGAPYGAAPVVAVKK
jgi:hypothetical protein